MKYAASSTSWLLSIILPALLLTLATAPVPAQAKEHYGTDIKAQPMPVILGVALNGRVGDYPQLTNGEKDGDITIYEIKGNTGKQFGGLAVINEAYLTRENKILGIGVSINAADAPAARGWLSGIYGPPIVYKDNSPYWLQNGFFVHFWPAPDPGAIIINFFGNPDNTITPPKEGDVKFDTTGDPDAGPPVVAGVHLGDKAAKYPELKQRLEPGDALTQYMGIYRLPKAEGYSHEGVPIRNLSFTTYKGVIYGVKFEIARQDAERLKNAFSGKYFLPGRLDSGGRLWDAYEIQARMKPLPGKDEDQVVFTWKPVVNQIIKDQRGDDPVAVNGVIMGGKIKDYPFLERYESEPHGTERYRIATDIPPMFGVKAQGHSYAAFDGRISLAWFTFAEEDLPAVIKGLKAQYGPPDEGDARHYRINLGDVIVEAEPYENKAVLGYRHSPATWAADRAVDKYYATHGQ